MYARVYKYTLMAGRPFLESFLLKREAKGKEDKARRHERRGQPKMSRPEGKVIWCHGASVGESISLLSLVDRLLKKYPKCHVMVTTGTVTSAKVMAERLPDRAFHQYIPVDHPKWVSSFLDHWQPDMVIWTESDFWPNILAEVKSRAIPAVLLNSRISKKSFKRWKFFSGWAKEILSTFRLCLSQNQNEANRLTDLGAYHAEPSGNLKYASLPLPYDEKALADFENQIENRTKWQVVCTHLGEEEIMIRVHKALSKKLPAVLTVIIPRHPDRGAEIAELCQKEGVTCALRSANEKITDDTQIYIADTLGEMGLFLRAIPLVVMGGSFIPHGGHNPIEPAQLSCQLIYGPHMFNFITICEDFEDAGAVRKVATEAELITEIEYLFINSVEGRQLSENAYRLAMSKSGVVDDMMRRVRPVFESAGLK